MTVHRLQPRPTLPGTPNGPVTASLAAAPDTKSDEALLEEIDQTLSSSVPTPMQALADPTASATTSPINPKKELT